MRDGFFVMGDVEVVFYLGWVSHTWRTIEYEDGEKENLVDYYEKMANKAGVETRREVTAGGFETEDGKIFNVYLICGRIKPCK